MYYNQFFRRILSGFVTVKNPLFRPFPALILRGKNAQICRKKFEAKNGLFR
jgi:hypothetical protein